VKEGVVAGLVAALASAIAITLVDASVLSDAIASLYGFSGSLLAGWVAHLAHGALFGLEFAAVSTDPMLSGARKRSLRVVIAAIVFGLVLAVAGAGVVMPMWLDALGVGSGEPLARLSMPLILWHGLYGLVLGVGFAVLDDADPAMETARESG
jgi:hypothetical protein